MQPETHHIGDAIALVALEIIATIYPDSDEACAKLDLLGGRLLDAVRRLEPGPTHDIVKATGEIFVMSEV